MKNTTIVPADRKVLAGKRIRNNGQCPAHTPPVRARAVQNGHAKVLTNQDHTNGTLTSTNGHPKESTNQLRFSGDKLLDLYLRDIREVPLLTKDEVIIFTKRIQRGDKTALDHLVCANLRLVVKIAGDYENLGLPLLDLISEGNIGLMEAAERFKLNRASFSTHAAWWIKQTIRRALDNQSRTIRLPTHVVGTLTKMRKVVAKLEEILDREPTDQETGEEVGMTAEEVRRTKRAAVQPLSIDAKIGDDDSTTSLSDIIADQRASTPAEALEQKVAVKLLFESMRNLSAREVTILQYRFGLDDKEPLTLEEVGKMFGITRERIRQIQVKALKRLRGSLLRLEK
jgi:RNA polymerase primary sigma factor